MTTIVLGLRILLAVVFLTAGVGKLLDLAGSRQAVRDFGVPDSLAGAIGTLLPFVELATGVALVFPPTARWGAVVAFLLLVGFMIGIARALARGEEPDCHCFGQIHSAPAGPITLIRNGALAACALVIVVYGSGPAVDTWVNDRSASGLIAAAAVIVAIAAVGYAVSVREKIGRLEMDLSIARQSANLGRAGLPVGFDAPDFALKGLRGETVTLATLQERGEPILLLFMTPWCGPCSSMMPKVQQWQQTLSARVTIAIISAGTPEDNEAFVQEGIEDVLLQEESEMSEAYRVKGTPSGVFISRDGKIASNPGEAEGGIEPLVRLALQGGLDAPMERSLA